MNTPDSEEWRSVVGYELLYSVSSRGRIRRDVPGGVWPAGRLLRTQIKTNGGVGRKRYSGYIGVRLTDNGVTTNHRVAILVAAAFVGPRPVGTQVNHIDGNKANNSASNLEWVTPVENRQHAARTGLNATGTRHGSAKLTESQVREIRAADYRGWTYALMAKFGISKSAIQSARSRRTWRHI